MSIELPVFDRDHELNTVFSDENKKKGNKKERNREAARKNEFLNHIIRIVYNDVDGKPRQGCDWTVARRKLNLKTLRDLLKRSPYPRLEIDYFYDNDNTPFWLDDLLLKAQPIPTVYSIVPLVRRTPFDIKLDGKYDGQTSFVLSGVPLRAIDEKTTVTTDALRQWITVAIIEEDPYSVPFVNDIAKINAFIKEIDKKIKHVSKLEFFKDDGSPMTVEQAEKEREILYNAYGEQRIEGEKRLKMKEAGLASHRLWRSHMGMEFTMGDIDTNTETATWFVRFYGTDDWQEIEDLLIKKTDWSGIKLSCGSMDVSPVLKPWAGRGNVPNGSKTLESDYTPYIVNMAGVRISRIPHGVGSYRALDRSSAEAIYDDTYQLFYGNWDCGRKTGHGIEFSDIGVFAGRYVEGRREGHGRLDYADGTTLEGVFGSEEKYPEMPNPLFTNPYCDGDLHGQVEILFGDGACYRGKMKHGRITGEGEYQSALGEIILGTFDRGILHGPHGYHKNLAGEKFLGSWIQGELMGEGSYENERGDRYDGDWEYSLRHGRGKYSFQNRGVYSGYFIHDCMSGKGELLFDWKKPTKSKQQSSSQASSNAPPSSTTKLNSSISESGSKKESQDKEKEEEDEGEFDPELDYQPEYASVYQGFFIANSLTSGGSLMDTTKQMPQIISKRDRRTLWPVYSMLQRIEKTTKGIRRQLEKNSDMEHFLRADITKKKIKIFRQQKHFTKKSMYGDEVHHNLSKADWTGRQQVRNDRLANVPLDKLAFEKAQVPHLKIMKQTPVTTLSNVLNLIRPDADNGDVRQGKRALVRLAVSDMEESLERQRYLKYDSIWKRAEEAFVKKKSGEK